MSQPQTGERMIGDAIISYLLKHQAIRVDEHFVYTSEKHGPHFINMRAVAQHAKWMAQVAFELAKSIEALKPDIILGPETLGRNLATLAGVWLENDVDTIWCNFEGEGKDKHAVFNPKLDFGRLLKGKRVVILDDLLTTGSSLRQVVALVEQYGGVVVGAAVVVRRTPDVVAQTCNVPVLRTLSEAPPGFVAFDPEECKISGPCSRKVPMVLRPGHGHEWILKKENKDYPVAA